MTEKASPTLTVERKAAWVEHRERGSPLLLRVMRFLSLRFGRRLSRVILYGIALYFFLFAPSARRASKSYLRLALGREPTVRDRFLHVLYFATTIHDRVYLINGQFEKFNISVEGEEPMRKYLGGRGVMLLGAHMGSFEVMHSVGRRLGGLRITMAMYEDNARKISSILAAINPKMEPDIVSLGRVGAMIDIAGRLDQGGFVGVLGDRTLGAEGAEAVSLLGEPANLPQGPLRAAAILRCPVYFMAGLYRGRNNYHLVFERVADFTGMGAGERGAAVSAAIVRYASLLDKYCRSDPYNWFNFFDFWHAYS
jgi:predicted LPLAT superfamily acyltransferase